MPEHLILPTMKFAHPRLPLALVVRKRLLESLETALVHRLILVSASAGWGKTTLLSGWAQTLSFPVAWLSLDELDNSANHFWIAAIAALRRCVPNVGSLALEMLQSPEHPPLPTILTALLNDVTDGDDAAPIVLILDDYHFITDEAIHESLSFFVEHLPPHLHLVIATRVDPPLPLARWRVGGQLLELRTDDLRFNHAEAERFFAQRLGNMLQDDDVRLLEHRTEGWVAGLHLAALGLHGRADHSTFVQTFTGGHRYLLDYVQDEILGRQPVPMQRFLLQIAVLRRMNAALCDAVTGQAASQVMLEALERQNLFVVPLDDERHWYRMHDLFREVLLARLQATEPALMAGLQSRAAHWHAAHNQMREGIEYALLARDWAFAAECIEQNAADLWRRGEAKLVHSWIRSIPDLVLRQHARLALEAALHLLQTFHAAAEDVFRYAQQETEQAIRRVQAQLEHLPQHEQVLLQRRIRLLQALIQSRPLLIRGDAEGIRLLMEETEALSDENIHWQLIPLSIGLWYIESMLREGALLIPRLLEAKRHALASGDQPSILRVRSWLAFAYLRAAQFRSLEQECHEALALTEPIGEHSAIIGYFHFFLFNAYYASNRLSEAVGAAHQMLRIARLWRQIDLLYAGHYSLVVAALASGNHAAAKQALAELEQVDHQEHLAAHAPVLATARVQYWLATGNIQAARNWAAQQMFSPEAWDPNRQWEFLQVIRVLLAHEQHAEALRLIEQFHACLDRPGDTNTAMQFLALHVVSLQGAKQREQAHTAAARLLALTASEDNFRVYLDAGEPMRRVLHELHDTPSGENELTPAARASIPRLLQTFETEAEQHTPALPATLPRPSALAEPLTEREREVLRLLTAGASNQEIAVKLVISLRTVKKHVSNILGKMGVSSRAQATARARDLPDLL